MHGDFTIDNVLIHGGRITGIIDWAGAAYGDPRYDVALAVRPKPSVFTQEDAAAFYKGYGKTALSNNEFHYFAEGLYEFF
ncbi:aminoglycoside phosphotransferase family protein [Alkalicoccus luteus]|uniref:Aminoglycoside phosphotransferase family protein n=1 Tax=Alkalicoccus luteus TaxID=1237094 RepID=A0A969PUB9_9BACI|nr:aminoglycoside phosphotransferase family protein [Alkalicoccus luteus]